MAIATLGTDTKLFGCQRVPYIARVKEYGHAASLLDYREVLNLAFWSVSEYERSCVVQELREIFSAPINIMPHALIATLTNSNPILHPSRLYSLFKDYDYKYPMSVIPRFYENWTDDSSEILIACDREFQTMLSKLGLESHYTPPLLEYYESHDVQSLTRKIASIESLKELKVPMVECEGGYALDWDNRYFTEDIPYGMLLIKYVCQLINVQTPNIDKIITWYKARVDKHYLDGREVANSHDVAEIACLNKEALHKLISDVI